MLNPSNESYLLSDFVSSEPSGDVGEEETPFLVDLYVSYNHLSHSM